MMKTTHKWLSSYIETGLDAAQMASALTLSGTEVEVSEVVGDDTAYTLEVTSNRTDCLSAIGLARELSAVTGKPVKIPQPNYPTNGKAASVSSVHIESDALAGCPYYTAHIIEGIKVRQSPAWLRARLEAIGLKPINNVVDVTNFVLFETGQPLHAFDLNKLSGRKIIVRMARPKERFKPIADRKNRGVLELDASTLVICDAERPHAVGGVMGGGDSEVTEKTTAILLESAYFEPASIRATSRRLELASDSSFRFERGVDPHNVVHAGKRAVELILEHAGGDALEGMLEGGVKPKRVKREIPLTTALIKRVLGADISLRRAAEILTALGLDCGGAGTPSVGVVFGSPQTTNAATSLSATVPSFRRDLEQPVDLVEEIGRVHGLDNIPARLAMRVNSAPMTRRQHVRGILRRTLCGMGFYEGLSDSFVSAKGALADYSPFGDAAVRLEARKPINEELPALRRNLLASLMLALQTNQRHGTNQPRLFELAHVYLPSNNGASVGERESLALIGADYHEVKGVVESLLRVLKSKDTLAVEAATHAAFTPGSAAKLKLGDNLLGIIGEASASLMKDFGCEGACGLAELDFEVLAAAWVETPKFVEPARFPAAQRDLAVVLDARKTWSEVEVVAKKAGGALLREATLFDEFRGKQIAPGKKSLAFSLTFRHDERTLTTEEVQAAVDAVVAALKAIGGELRA
ncbi:MAG: phenylalanine--tRNA ligase subunit beta [Planctomycetes bacterium]|nr:phenylalanine--tRNA ligase subunit beta [Planctomycetota bacterium]